MLKTWRFYNLWLALFCTEYGIVFVSSLWKAYGQTFIHDDRFLAYVGAFSSVGNAAGRIIGGSLGDKYSFKVSILCVCSAFSALILTMEITRYGGKPLFFIWVCLLFLTFSGIYSLLPAEIARVFGVKYYSMNYGLMMSVTTVSGLTGAAFTSQLQKLLGWDKMFFTIAGIVLIGLILMYVYKDKQTSPPRDEESGHTEE